MQVVCTGCNEREHVDDVRKKQHSAAQVCQKNDCNSLVVVCDDWSPRLAVRVSDGLVRVAVMRPDYSVGYESIVDNPEHPGVLPALMYASKVGAVYALPGEVSQLASQHYSDAGDESE